MIRNAVLHLHSTMLLLYLWRPWATGFVCGIYIPLCFYFITVHQPAKHILKYIYIPLCFYFIVKRCVSLVCSNRHLHSTMLLLYPTPTWPDFLSDIIYIPLCFYFILSTHDSTESCVCIYIPLCFYFIVEEYHDGRYGTPFTFHYASTLSRTCSQL